MLILGFHAVIYYLNYSMQITDLRTHPTGSTRATDDNFLLNFLARHMY